MMRIRATMMIHDPAVSTRAIDRLAEDRKGLMRIVHTGLSRDIAAHEATHTVTA